MSLRCGVGCVVSGSKLVFVLVIEVTTFHS